MANQIPLGIKIPYTRGNLGYFDQTFSDIERCKTNLKMLLMTAKGERPMMPTYGSDLRSLLFNPGEAEYDQLLEDAVIEAAEKWMPEVTINSVEIERNIEEYPNRAILNITFSINSIPNNEETMELEVQ